MNAGVSIDRASRPFDPPFVTPAHAAHSQYHYLYFVASATVVIATAL